MIDSLTQEVDNQTSALAYFYCDYADSETLDLMLIVGTIILQLLIVKPTLPEPIALDIRDIFGDGLRRPTPDRLITLLCNVAMEYTNVFVFLDGIDEVDLDTQGAISSLVRKLIAIGETLTKVFVSSRESSCIAEAMGCYPRIRMSEDCIRQDVEAYILASVNKKLSTHSVLQDNPELRRVVEEELMVKAEGM